jgi:hypothetical protein
MAVLSKRRPISVWRFISDTKAGRQSKLTPGFLPFFREGVESEQEKAADPVWVSRFSVSTCERNASGVATGRLRRIVT